ncbi:long-chain-fatty-acid--CoA ligase [Mycolicibacterium sp. P9-22]|uniref:long-chain-fatty-acid--CoA ligase n=1 Tax=Mycolicibacterium sp. P9-22 TaxID=2024613 RepID=UPI0018845EBD|nr:long-chain-fatty-acid--CoA ligase [Mycolicibacterium sp. P9-22]
MIDALTMDDYPLSLTTLVERAQLFTDADVVTRRPDGRIVRSNLGECARRARHLATALAGLGVGPGDLVATLLWNQAEHLELYFAVPAMGATLHTLNPRLHPDELAFIANDACDSILVVDESLLDVASSVIKNHSFKNVIVVTSGQPIPDGMIGYESCIATTEPMGWPTLDERSPAVMCYTSGTTGRPKGVVYSHRALVLHSMAAALPDVIGISRQDTVLPVVPLFHANAWGLPYAAALVGASIILPGPLLDPVNVLDLLATEHVTVTAGVPTVWMAMLAALDAEPHRWDLSRLKRLIVGGAAVPRSMFEGYDKHGLDVIQAWGMTELAPLGATSRLPREPQEGDDPDARYAYRARQGTALPLIEIRAVDDTGSPIDWDDTTVGELEVRGPWVAGGYHNGRGADSFTADGWFRTGDVVHIDQRGSIRISDRVKDLVKSGGEWISSVDLENHLMNHRAVAEAAVIAIPDPRWGERPLAVVVPRIGHTVEPGDLRNHLLAHFAKWQVPERFEFVSEIPRTATGKFRKTALRAQFPD